MGRKYLHKRVMLAFSFCSEFMSTDELVTLAVELIVCAVYYSAAFFFVFVFFFRGVACIFKILVSPWIHV